MVKIGIIVEGDCEKIVLDSPMFQSLLAQNQLVLADEVINIQGKSKLKPDAPEVNSAVQILFDQGAEWILLLRDMDDAPSFETVSKEVYQTPVTKLCLAVKEFEAWYLADSEAMHRLLKMEQPFFHDDAPEALLEPGQLINELSLQYTGRGIGWSNSGAKIKLAKRMLANGFTIEKAARHPNCPSAQYFLSTLQTLASAN